MTGKTQENWKSRYNREVEMQTQRYIALNAISETIIRKITPEEKEEYERLLTRKNKNYLYSNINKSTQT